MERAKNLERRELSDELNVSTRLENLSVGNIGFGSSNSNQNLELQSSSAEESDIEELPENMILSFSTGTDDDILQKEYDMLSSSSMNDVTEQGDENIGDIIGTGLDGEVLNGVYFDKLELELNAIEQAMSQFEGRLDLLREQAQDLLSTLQSERLTAAATDDLKSPSEQFTADSAQLHGGSGDDH